MLLLFSLLLLAIVDVSVSSFELQFIIKGSKNVPFVAFSFSTLHNWDFVFCGSNGVKILIYITIT